MTLLVRYLTSFISTLGSGLLLPLSSGIGWWLQLACHTETMQTIRQPWVLCSVYWAFSSVEVTCFT